MLFLFSVSLADRTFSSKGLYEMFKGNLQPVGLRYFQSEWGRSVSDVYHKVLGEQSGSVIRAKSYMIPDREVREFQPPSSPSVLNINRTYLLQIELHKEITIVQIVIQLKIWKFDAQDKDVSSRKIRNS